MLSVRTYAALALPLALAATAATVPPALASGGGGGVRASGGCSAHSTWKLKGKVDNGALQAEFEVDSNVVGQTWTWKLTDNATAVAHGTSRTVAPSGSFTVARRTANRAGVDVLRFRATNPATGEVCSGSVRV